MKWPLIAIRSSQQASPRFVSSLAQICSTSEEISVNCSNSAALNTSPRPSATRFILAILAIELAIATIFGDLFKSESPESVGFNKCHFCDVLSSPPNDTIGAPVDTSVPAFYLHPTGVGLAEFGNLGCDLYTVLSAQATATTVTIIPNENKSGPIGPHTQTHTHTQTTYTTAPAIASIDKISPTGVGLRDSDINGCVFGVVFNEYEFNNEINNIFGIYFNENFYDNDIDNAYYYATPGERAVGTGIDTIGDALETIRDISLGCGTGIGETLLGMAATENNDSALLLFAPNILDNNIIDNNCFEREEREFEIDIFKGEEEREEFGAGVPLLITVHNIVLKFLKEKMNMLMVHKYQYQYQHPATIMKNNNDTNLGALLAFEKKRKRKI